MALMAVIAGKNCSGEIHEISIAAAAATQAIARRSAGGPGDPGVLASETVRLMRAAGTPAVSSVGAGKLRGRGWLCRDPSDRHSEPQQIGDRGISTPEQCRVVVVSVMLPSPTASSFEAIDADGSSQWRCRLTALLSGAQASRRRQLNSDINHYHSSNPQ